MHENVVFGLLYFIKRHLTDHSMDGEAIGSKFALKLPNGKRPEPDIVIVPIGQVADSDSIFEGIPLLVIEILSISNREHDLSRKRMWYQEAKIPEIWIVDIEERTIHVDYLETNLQYMTIAFQSGKVKSRILNGLEIPFDQIVEF